MKLTLELDVKWLDDDGSLDEAIEQRVITHLAEKIQTNFLLNAGETLALKAEKLITAKVELLINTMLEQPVVVSQGWGTPEKYDSINDMVEQKMVALYQGKLDNKGKCTKDPLLAKIENIVKAEIERSINETKSLITREGKRIAKETLDDSSLMKAISALINKKG